MISVQGHLIALKDQNPKDRQHIISIYAEKDKTKSGQKVQRLFYTMPKYFENSGENDVGVIGGTFIEDATPETPNEEEFDLLLTRAKKFYGIK
jgi:hypothetical protein